MARRQVKNFAIVTPRGVVYTCHGANGRVTSRLEWNPDMPRNMGQKFSRAQKFVDADCIRRMTRDKIHPKETGVLKRSATLGTVIGSGQIIQATPCARRQYYEHKEKSEWFETMVNRDKDAIQRGAQKILEGK